jgi:hypothetical protein
VVEAARPMPCDAPVTSTRSPLKFRRAMSSPSARHPNCVLRRAPVACARPR